MKNDSAILYLMDNKRIDLDSFYRLLPAGQYRYLSNTETYDQMKSSGSLRYIKDTALLRKIIAYNNSSKAAQFRSVTQEYDYLANEYVTSIQKWMPAEIAAKRHADPYITSKVWLRLLYTDANKKLMRRLYDAVGDKKFYLEGKELELMKKELIPVIARKTYLTSASALYLTVTYDHAVDLNNYYHKNNHE
jgi:hypothetical protein